MKLNPVGYLSKIFTSKLIVVITSFIIFYSIFNIGYYKKENGVIAWDVILYYAYLPISFIYNEIFLDSVDTYSYKNNVTIWNDHTEKESQI